MRAAPAESVAVLIPAYNAAGFLATALDSTLAQTRRAERIIVVDDGSTDDTAAIARGYMARNPDAGIEVIQQANMGEVGARNTGIRAAIAHGDVAWVAMLDADDWWEPRKLELQLTAAKAAGPDCVLVHTGSFTERPDAVSVANDFTLAAKRAGPCIPVLTALLEPGSIAHASIMVRLDALEKIKGYDPEFPHACDVNVYFRLAPLGTFAFVPERLLHYRIHAGQTSFNFKLDQARYQVKVARDFFGKHPELAERIGRKKIESELAGFIALKLESLYWRRRLSDFRSLLAYAQEQDIDSPGVAAWRRKARYPDWMIRLKDRFAAGAKA